MILDISKCYSHHFTVAEIASAILMQWLSVYILY